MPLSGFWLGWKPADTYNDTVYLYAWSTGMYE